MPKESPWVYLFKMWWHYRYLCIVHILVITIVKFFITLENAGMVMRAEVACAVIVFLSIVSYTKDPRTTIIIVIINSIVAPMITTVVFYPFLMILGQALRL